MIKIGTRGSKLALWQAYHVADKLKKAGLDSEIIPIETKGDRIQNVSYTQIGTKGLFTEEIEDKLRSKEIQLAVHSAKDVQSELFDDLEILAFCEREKPNDVLVSFNKSFSLNKPGKKIVGTSSSRRRAILNHYYPEIELREARGNLQTRFQKMEENQFEAMILAFAGVHRMKLNEYIVEELPLNIFTSPVGQGCVAVEAAKNLNPRERETIKAALNHTETEIALLCERAYLKKLEGGCSIPSFGIAKVENNILTMSAGIISLDGKDMVRKSISGSIQNPEALGLELAEQVLSDGGEEILREIKKVRK